MTQPEALRLADALEDTDSADDHDDAAAELRRLHAENEALKRDVHNLNWALGKDDYPTMATPEEQASADEAMRIAEERIETLRCGTESYEALRNDAERYRFLRVWGEIDAALMRFDCRGVCIIQREAMDTAIDAAMAQESKS